MKTSIHILEPYKFIRLQGEQGDFLSTHHTESYPRSRNPNVVIMVSGTLDWINEDVGQVFYRLNALDTGDKLPDPIKGNYRFEVVSPSVDYYCVSRTDGKAPKHRQIALTNRDAQFVTKGSAVMLLKGTCQVLNGIKFDTPGLILNIESGDNYLRAPYTDGCVIEVFE